MGDEVRDPRRTLPRSIYISAPFVAFIYIAGTLAVLWLIPTREVNIVSGFLQAIAVGAKGLGWGIAWLPVAGAALYVLGNLGGVGAWLTGPARVAFVIGLDRYFPPAFGRIHPKWKTPYVALLTQSVLATIFLFLSVLGKGTTVEKAYLVILDTMLLVYFIPYLYLFATYLKEGEAGERAKGRKGSALPPRYRNLRSRAHAVGHGGRDRASIRYRALALPAQGHRRGRLLRRAGAPHLLEGTEVDGGRNGGRTERRYDGSCCPFVSAVASRLLRPSAFRPRIFAVLSTPAAAQRAPVLQQVKVRHPYYYREMFIPQPTSGTEQRGVVA